MHLEEFAAGDSFLHRADPRVKFLASVPYVFVIALMDGLMGPSLALLASALLTASARLNPGKLLQRLLAVNLFIALLWVFLPFTYPGEALFAVGPLRASREGLLYALSITLKSNAIVLATIAMLGTSGIFSLAHALVHLRVPTKLVHLFFFFYRYISVLHEEYHRLRDAMRIRCFRAGTNVHTYRSLAYLLGMLIVRSYERSQRIYWAMLCRGFKDRFPVMSHFSLKKGDVLFGCLMTVLTGLLVVLWRAS